MSCPNAANVNVVSLPPPSGCTPVEGCPDGEPVVVTGEVAVINFPASQAVTIADCADVVEGCLNDAKVIGDNPGTVSGKLRGLAYTVSNWWDGVNQWLNVQPLISGVKVDVLPLLPGVQEGPGWGTLSFISKSTTDILRLVVGNILYAGVNGFWWRQRTPYWFKTVQAVAAGNTALWTPTAGTSFRLMRYKITLTGDASFAGAAVLTVKLFDGAAGATGQEEDFYVPLVAGIVPGMFTTGWIDLGNGYLSAAVNNVLNVNLSAALATGNVRVVCCGTEE